MLDDALFDFFHAVMIGIKNGSGFLKAAVFQLLLFPWHFKGEFDIVSNHIKIHSTLRSRVFKLCCFLKHGFLNISRHFRSFNPFAVAEFFLIIRFSTLAFSQLFFDGVKLTAQSLLAVPFVVLFGNLFIHFQLQGDSFLLH